MHHGMLGRVTRSPDLSIDPVPVASLPGPHGRTSETGDLQAAFKQQATEYAVRHVESGMAVGLGTGSTAIFSTRLIGNLLASGKPKGIVGFATSQLTRNEAVRLNIPMNVRRPAARARRNHRWS